MAFDMLQWLTMSPTLRTTSHLEGTGADLIVPTNPVFTVMSTGRYYWIKSNAGFPWDINIFDDSFIYLSTTELTFASATEGKRFESLDPAIGFKGVPFAKRLMNPGESVLSLDTRFGIYTSCGTATFSNLGKAKVTLTGPFIETIPGAGGNLPSNLLTLHLEYEWSLDASYNHQAGSVKETYTLAQPYGLVNWQTQNWNTSTSSYGSPTNASHFNILAGGAVGIIDPCPFGVDGGGSSAPILTDVPPSPQQFASPTNIVFAPRVNPTLFQYDTLYFLEPVQVTHWQSQPTAFEFPGFVHCRDAYIAIRSNDTVTLTVVFDNGTGTETTQTYTIPSTGGQRLKQYIQFAPNKGLLYRFSLDSQKSFRVYEPDLEIRVKPWLGVLGYATQRVLGGESNA